MAFGLRCPECRKSFRYDPLAGHPRFCPLCKADMGEEEDDSVISIPAFLSAHTKGTDKVARDLMDASNVRAEKAAAFLGVPVSEMSDMKVTDLRSTKHQGDMAIAPVVNEVTRQMDAINKMGGHVGWQGQTGAEYSSAVQTGPYPNAGAKVRSLIHQANGAVSDRPALETMAPGYVRRS